MLKATPPPPSLRKGLFPHKLRDSLLMSYVCDQKNTELIENRSVNCYSMATVVATGQYLLSPSQFLSDVDFTCMKNALL